MKWWEKNYFCCLYPFKMKILYLGLLLFLCNVSIAQKPEYAAALIAPELKENANSVVRLEDREMQIVSQRSMKWVTRKVVTILNSQGLDDMDLYESYDKNHRINKIEARFYNAAGDEIKVVKRKDFKDVSVGDGFSVFNDNRAMYAEYTPVGYPFTVVFESEITTSNTAFIPRWLPLDGYYISTEKKRLHITYPADLGFSFRENNMNATGITKVVGNGEITFEASALHAMKNEQYSPSFDKWAPVAYFRLDKFNLEGVDGQAQNWEEFGKWMYGSLLTGTDELPLETQNKIRELVGNEKDIREITRIVYNYVQQKTRYVSIQVGIGGFKPMLAKDVDKLGYGDCKALSNYTRALLEAVNVPSYYTIVFAGKDRKGLIRDFTSMQGNHAILAVPDKGDLIWLECTSQVQPFGFQGTFTDDRDVLIVKPEGGQIVHTRKFLNDENSQLTKGEYAISSEGNLSGKLHMALTGSQYDDTFEHERMSPIDRDDYFKRYFDNINNLKIGNVKFENDRKAIAFKQELELSAANYASNTGGKLMFVLNAYNASGNTPKRYRKRENPFEVARGYYDADDITIALPADYQVEAIPSDFELKGKFGEYSTKVTQNPDHTLTYKRTLLIKDGTYTTAEYEDYRNFREQIAKNDNAKVVLSKKS